jgi:predicted TIM-barrel fold metal-dependent hydrolase
MPLQGRSQTGPIIDCNVHLWDQQDNPIFWLSDRTLVRDMLGDYESLPDRYLLSDYRRETADHDVRGVIWSDAGAADPLAAAAWVTQQQNPAVPVVAIVTLGDPFSATFAELVRGARELPLIRSVRIRLVAELTDRSGSNGDFLNDPLIRTNLGLLADSGLVATLETTADQLDIIARLAAEFPGLRVVVDHFGWPTDPREPNVADHMERLARVAAASNVATRIDAIGTIFGDWTAAQIRPWLLAVTETFGTERCMLGSDLPIENLRSGFGQLYATYDEIFSGYSHEERAMLFGLSAERWYAME